jgi:tRNA dimethylallyltransferase
MIGLVMNRAKLYERINQRVDAMIERGLLNEVKSLLDKGYTRNMVSMQGLGYKEIIDYYQGRLTLEEAIYKLKQETRRYAKRQLTWFRAQKGVKWINIDDYSSERDIIECALMYIADKISF